MQANPSLSAEQRLLDTVQRLDRYREGRLALHIHLSRLQAEHRREHHIRVAAQTLHNSLGSGEGEMFILRNRDLVFVGKNVAEQVAEDAIIRLRYLFSEDPLIQFSEEGLHEEFCSWYYLDQSYDDLLTVVQQMATVARSSRSKVEETAKPKEPLAARHLVEVENTLELGNISAFVRNQPICAIAGNKPPYPVYDEIFVAIGQVQQKLMPDVDLRSNRWLFLRLTELLDQKILQYLRGEARFRKGAFSVNLNLSTILTPEFLKIDEDLNSSLRGRMLVELQATDIFADMGSFLFARDYLKERGHRICLDGLTHTTLPFFAQSDLKFDLVKLFWSPRLADPRDAAAIDSLRETIKTIGKSRVILSRCDNDQAIKVGQSLGIDLFQGFAIDKLRQEKQSQAA